MQILIYLYKQTLNQSNITYIIKKIKQKHFKELNVLVPQAQDISNIPKTIIFIDKIENKLKIAQ